MRREVTIRYTNTASSDTSSTETDRLSMSEEGRVEAFISGLKHHRSHFLIIRPSTIEDMRQTIL